MADGIIRRRDNGSVDSSPTITDAEHGSRAGGTLHALATITTPGFMSAVDKQLLTSLAFTNVAAIEAFDVSSMDTVFSWVKTFRDIFVLDKTSTLTVDHITVLSATGGGRWIRKGFADLFWQQKTSWQIDPSAGNDENDGTTLPLKTHAEYVRRVHGNVYAQDCVITLLGALPNSDAPVLDFWTLGTVTVYYKAAPTVIGTGTFTSVTVLDKSTNQPWLVTDTAIGTSWTVSGFVQKMIRAFDGSNNLLATAYVGFDEGSKSVFLSQPNMYGDDPTALDASASSGFAIGQNYKVYSKITVPLPRIPNAGTNVVFHNIEWGTSSQTLRAAMGTNIQMSLCETHTNALVLKGGNHTINQCAFWGGISPQAVTDLRFGVMNTGGGLWATDGINGVISTGEFLFFNGGIRASNGEQTVQGDYGACRCTTQNPVSVDRGARLAITGRLWGKSNSQNAVELISASCDVTLSSANPPLITTSGSEVFFRKPSTSSNFSDLPVGHLATNNNAVLD